MKKQMKSKENFNDIIGYENVKRELNVIVDMVLNCNKYMKMGVKPIKGILLHGDHGTGKTTMAKDFIKATGLESFKIVKNKPDGEFVNHITDVFKKANQYANVNNSVAIVFLDDLDKFAESDHYSRNCEEYITVQSCMDDFRDKPIIVIATANDIDDLPESLLRVGRFDKVLEIKNPSREDAASIVKHYLNKKENIGEINCEEIAQILSGGSCAQLESVINEAAISVAYNNGNKIEMKDIIKAAMRVIYNAPEKIDAKEDNYLINVACHEAGHAIVGELLEPGSINLVSIAKYDGQTGGITSYNQSDDYFKSIDFMENRVMTLLAGKAASEVVFGVNDTGCNGDLHRAYKITTRFIDDYCTLGFNNWEGITNKSSNELRDRKETLVSFQMQQYYNKVKKMIIDNRKFLDAVANKLIENITITQNDIKIIKQQI